MTDFKIRVVVDPSGAARGTKQVEGNLDRVSQSATRVHRLLARAFAFTGIGVGLSATLRTLASFEQQMSTVKAITGATEAQFNALRLEAQKLGSTTRFSASEAAEGMQFLARAGFDVSQVLSSIDDTLLLAQAGALDLASAADIASNVLTGFRLEAEEAGRVVDVLALASNSANTNVFQLGEAMKFVAPVAAGLGVSVEEAAAAVSALSDAGLQGSLAGTGLRRILSELESPASKTVEILEKLGVSADDVRISQVGLTTALIKLKDAGVDTGLALELFGDRGGPAFEVLSNAIPRVQELTESLEGAEGTARRIADTMDDNLNGALLSVKSAAEGIIIAFGDSGATAALTSFFRSTAEGLRFVSDNIEVFSTALEILSLLLISRFAGQAIGAVLKGFGLLKVAVATSIQQHVALQVALGGASVAQSRFAAATVAAQAAMRGLTLAIAANPIGLLLTVLAIAVPLLLSLNEQARATSTVMQDLENDLKQVQEAFRESGDNAALFREELEAITRTEVLARQVELADKMDQAFLDVLNSMRPVLIALEDMGSEGHEVALSLVEMVQEASAGERSLQSVITALDGIGANNEVFAPIAADAIRATREALELDGALDKNNAILRLLEGTASDADRALLGLASSADVATGSANSLSAAANSASSAISTLTSFIPELAKAAKAQGQLTEAQAAFEQGRSAIESQIGNGLSIDQGSKRIAELTEVYNRAVSEIDGSAEATRRADEALQDYTTTAEHAALSGTAKAIAIETDRYEELRSALEASGASQQELNAASEAYNQIVASIKKSEGSGGSGGSSASSVRDSNEALKEQQKILEDIISPQEELAARVDHLNSLYSQGALTAHQYAEALRDAAIGQAELRIQAGDGSFADGFIVQLERMTEAARSFKSSAGTIFGEFFDSFSSGFSRVIGDAIWDTDNLTESLKSVARDAISGLISSLVQLGLQFLANQILSATLGAAAVATSGAQAAATASAWAPAAAAASLASFGANALPAAAGITSTFALTQGLAAVGAAFADGTSFVQGAGNSRSDSVLAALSVGEGVVTAKANRENPGVVSAMNSGAKVGNNSRPLNINYTIVAKDADSFRRSERQTLASTRLAMTRASRRDTE